MMDQDEEITRTQVRIEQCPVLTCDVLVAGGGSAGMMAAISAAEAGASVILAEKANTRRSGAGATGNDHFQCYIPEVHGSRDDFMKLYMHDRPGPGMCKDIDVIDAFVDHSFDMVKKWESWGIQMRPHGYWEMSGHALPWVKGTHLKYEGVDQKPTFTKEALKLGVKILNRHPITEVITDDNGAVCGAILADLTEETPKMQVVRCKSVILCTAKGNFASGSDRMGWLANNAASLTNTGDASPIAYRAGARLVGYGVTGKTTTGPVGASKYFLRGGTRTWVGTYTDLNGTPYGPIGQETTYDVLNPGTPCEPHYVSAPTWETGDYTQYLPENKMNTAYDSGHPVFMDFEYNTEEDTEYMKWSLSHEGQQAVLDHLDEEGFDFHKHMIEFQQETGGGVKIGGPDINGYGETTVPGLYAAGEAVGNNLPGLSPSAVIGGLAGEHAAEYSRSVTISAAEERPIVQQCADHYSQLLSNEIGTASPTWKEAITTVQQITWDYCGSGVVSEELFEVGLTHLRRMRQKMNTLQCPSAHDFMRCLGAENVACNAELAMICGREKRESRGPVKYVDYPEMDHKYDGCYVAIQQVDGKPQVFTRAHRTSYTDGGDK